MKKGTIVMAGIITLGIGASVFTSNAYSMNTTQSLKGLETKSISSNVITSNYNNSNGFGMMGNSYNGNYGYGMMGNSYNGSYGSGMMGNSYNGGYGRGMMGSGYSSSEFSKYRGNNSYNCHGNNDYSIYEGQEKLSVEEIEEKVEEYVAYYYGEDLEIGDIFEFDRTDYYVSIEETAGRGAFELLVNPYTGDIRHEQGPNMMWNTKYGMMNDAMGYAYNATSGDEISFQQAVELANEFLEDVNIDGEVTEEGHEFYGYYTLHVENDDNVIGMLSVNAYTGETWVHDWHDDVINVYSHYED